MRLLYLYPEEWTGGRAREVQVLSTCVALAESGVDVTLVTAGGEPELRELMLDIADSPDVLGLELIALPRTLGPVESTSIFTRNFTAWLRDRRPFDLGYTIHLKAGPILTQAGIPYAYEAHVIFTQTASTPARQHMLHKVEAQVLNAAKLLIATSAPLAVALKSWFSLSNDFTIVPNAGSPPLDQGISSPDGPFIYCGSIADPNDFAGIISAAAEAKVPLRIIGGGEEEWQEIEKQFDTDQVEWHPGVAVRQLPEALADARAGLIPTNVDSPWGEFSSPMKLFDYAQCGLPVLTTSLPSLQSLEVGSWCTQLPSPARVAWVEAMKNFRHNADEAEAARAWSAGHTWTQRAELLKSALGG